MPKKIPKFKMIARSIELYYEVKALLPVDFNDWDNKGLKIYEVQPVGECFLAFFNYKELSGTLVERPDGTQFIKSSVDFWNEDSPFTFNLADEDLNIKEEF